MKKTMATKILLSFFVAICALACTPEVEPIRYGAENCAHCMMTISDRRFGAELLTQKGRVYKFDAVECLAAFHIENANTGHTVHSLWITDFSNPGTLINAETATYLRSTTLKSPMGLYLSGYGTRDDAEAAQAEHAGVLMGWPEVEAFVRNAWTDQKPGHSEGGENQ